MKKIIAKCEFDLSISLGNTNPLGIEPKSFNNLRICTNSTEKKKN
jgi:hypothetical protein